jgi:hypothetical protein
MPGVVRYEQLVYPFCAQIGRSKLIQSKSNKSVTLPGFTFYQLALD